MDLNVKLASIPNAEKAALFDNLVRHIWGKGVEISRVNEYVNYTYHANGVDAEYRTTKFYSFTIASSTDDFLQAIYTLPKT
jgi:hypothetical protein